MRIPYHNVTVEQETLQEFWAKNFPTCVGDFENFLWFFSYCVILFLKPGDNLQQRDKNLFN